MFILQCSNVVRWCWRGRMCLFDMVNYFLLHMPEVSLDFHGLGHCNRIIYLVLTNFILSYCNVFFFSLSYIQLYENVLHFHGNAHSLICIFSFVSSFILTYRGTECKVILPSPLIYCYFYC